MGATAMGVAVMVTLSGALNDAWQIQQLDSSSVVLKSPRDAGQRSKLVRGRRRLCLCQLAEQCGLAH